MEGIRLDRIGPLWLVGCGHMGGALLDRWLACGLDLDSVTVIDPSPKAVSPGVRIVEVPPEAGEPPNVVVLAVKPQLLAEVAARLSPFVAHQPLVISILAGAETATIATLLSPRVIRAMPNMPVRIGEGVTVLFGGAKPDRDIAHALMAAVGQVHWIDDEQLFDAVTGVSGSGPAYLFSFVEALAVAGVAAGLPAGLAQQLALDTVTGAAALAASGEASPAELRAQVTSPNGTTAAGLAVLDGERALTRLLSDTVAAAARRSRELAEG